MNYLNKNRNKKISESQVIFVLLYSLLIALKIINVDKFIRFQGNKIFK